MAQLTDEEIAIVERRIEQGGVANADLLNGLLDHYCCYIEERMDAGMQFDEAYDSAFVAISPNGVREIQEELFFLLTFKKQTNMKRVVLNSGIAGAAVFCAGLLFKFMHWPGAGACIVAGISLLSLVFLPLLFVLRLREQQPAASKVLKGVATLSGMLMSISILFLVMHWPGSLSLGYSAVGLMFLVFLPVYFFSGKVRQDTRISITVTSVMIIAGCGLWLTLVASPTSVRMKNVKVTRAYLRSEQILKAEQRQLGRAYAEMPAESKQILTASQEIERYLVERETGAPEIAGDFEATNLVLKDGWIDNYFAREPKMLQQLVGLKKLVATYNETNSKRNMAELQTISPELSILTMSGERTSEVLDELIQIQMIVLQNEQVLASAKNSSAIHN
jgi:hypothetical protein